MIQEERSVFWELIASVLEKSSYENFFNYEVLEQQKRKRNYLLLFLFKFEFNVQMKNFLEFTIIFQKSHCQLQ
jgi:hypothetical protein